MVKTIERSALVWHSAQNMFDLVNDVAAYPEFLPWCDRAEVLQQAEDVVVATVQIAKGGLRHCFTTRNQLLQPHQITMELIEGPFSHLSGWWRFLELDADACKVEFRLDYEVQGKIAIATVGPIFTQAANTMVDVFCKRAKQIYGGA